MAVEGRSINLPYPYPDLSSLQWDAFALLRNLQFIVSKVTALETGQLMPTGGIIMVRSGTTCPSGFTKIADAGLQNRYLRIATTGGGTGGSSSLNITASGAHTHHTSIPTSTRLVTSAAIGTTFMVSTSTHIHTISSSGTHTHAGSVTPIFLDVILCEKD